LTFLISGVNVLDAIIIKSNLYWYRGIVMLVYVLAFLMVIILAELIGRNLRDLFAALFPKQSTSTSFYAGVLVEKARLLMEDNVEKEGKKVVSALQSILGREGSSSFNVDSTSFNAQPESSLPSSTSKNKSLKPQLQHSLSHVAADDSNSKGSIGSIPNPKIKKSKSFYQKYISKKFDKMIGRWIVVPRFLQLFCLCLIGLLIYLGQRAIREPHDQQVVSDQYIIIEDVQVWLQCIALVIILYMTWTPLLCPCSKKNQKSNKTQEKQKKSKKNSGHHKASQKVQEKTSGLTASVNSEDEMSDDTIIQEQHQDELYVPPPESF